MEYDRTAFDGAAERTGLAQRSDRQFDAVKAEAREFGRARIVAQQHARARAAFDQQTLHETPADEAAGAGDEHFAPAQPIGDVGDVGRRGRTRLPDDLPRSLRDPRGPRICRLPLSSTRKWSRGFEPRIDTDF
jgi:hypothetical protein